MSRDCELKRGRASGLSALQRSIDAPLVFDGNTHALGRLAVGGLNPSSGELDPRKGGRFFAPMEGVPVSDSARTARW